MRNKPHKELQQHQGVMALDTWK